MLTLFRQLLRISIVHIQIDGSVMIPKTDTLIEKVIDELQISIDLLNMLTMDFDLSLIRDYGGSQRYFSEKGLYKFRREQIGFFLGKLSSIFSSKTIFPLKIIVVGIQQKHSVRKYIHHSLLISITNSKY